MSKQEDQKFTDEAVTYGRTTRENDQIPVVEDSKTQSEGLDAIDDEIKNSDAQLGSCPHGFCANFSLRRQGSN
jgi:hypothetical protein